MLGVLSDEQIDQVLRSEVVGRIGCHDAGRPYVVPITYAYDGIAILRPQHRRPEAAHDARKSIRVLRGRAS